MVAPFDMHSRLIKLIERERDHARAGKPARIVAKLNAVVDQEIIEKLYEASRADVTIDLIVRGICCLRPKMPGLSENIRVISIVGRFLEHSRIFYFENAGQPRVFLSSADWMPRNFFRRIELAFPVENPALRDQIINEVLPSFLHDRVKARELLPDGTYRRLKPEGTEPRAQAQWHFREVSRERAKKMTGSKKKLRADKLIPMIVATDPPVTTNPETDGGEKSAPSVKTTPASPAPATPQRQS
jgi:polyphosphate kinase